MCLMTPHLRRHFDAELDQVAAATARGDHAVAWSHLERAHVLSQRFAGPHVRIHWAMLRYGWARRDRAEVLGQLLRLLLAAPGSWTGRAPTGNTGGANVGIFQPMPIPDDLGRMLDGEKAGETGR
jgi:hypothetical protein